MRAKIKKIVSLLFRFLTLLKDSIYSFEVHDIFICGTREQDNHFKVVEINRDTIFIAEYLKNIAMSFLGRGEIGFGAEINGKVVGFVWGREGPLDTYVGRETIGLPTGYVEIHYGVVDDAYRGRNVGGVLVKYIAEHFSNKTSIGFVNSKNIPAQKMHSKLGSKLIGKIVSLQILGFRFRNIYSDEIRLSFGETRDRRSFMTRVFDLPFELICLEKEKEQADTSEVIGSESWLSLLSSTMARGTLPVYLQLKHPAFSLVKIPCLISVGNRTFGLSISFDYTRYPYWPEFPGIPTENLLNMFFRGIKDKWYIEYGSWTVPYWVDIEKLDLSGLPKECDVAPINTWILDTQLEYAEVHRKFDKQTRRCIRIADKLGVKVMVEPNIAQLKNFADLWNDSYESRNWSGDRLSFQFLLSLKNKFHEHVRIILASLDEKIIAGCVFIEDRRGEIYFAGSMDRQYKKYYPMYAIFAHEIAWLCDNKKQYLNFGGIGNVDTLATFKEHWGAVPRPVTRIAYKNSSERPIARTRLSRALNMLVRLYFLFLNRGIH